MSYRELRNADDDTERALLNWPDGWKCQFCGTELRECTREEKAHHHFCCDECLHSKPFTAELIR